MNTQLRPANAGNDTVGVECPRRRPRRRAMTFVEIVVVMTVMGVLFAMAAPSFLRTMEQAHADIAGANLHAIWNAERFYWLENRTYTTNLATLESLGLLDPSVVQGTDRYTFSVTAADDASFTATAIRNSPRWNGTFTIDETGAVSGAVTAPGHPTITPGFH